MRQEGRTHLPKFKMAYITIENCLVSYRCTKLGLNASWSNINELCLVFYTNIYAECDGLVSGCRQTVLDSSYLLSATRHAELLDFKTGCYLRCCGMKRWLWYCYYYKKITTKTFFCIANHNNVGCYLRCCDLQYRKRFIVITISEPASHTKL